MAKKSKSAGPKVDPYLDGLFTKLLERLTSLDRKMDSLISRSMVKHPQNNNNPSAPTPPPQQQQAPARKERTLYEAICADCGKVCEVPFRPVEGRSVYCKECFGRRKGGHQHGMPILTPAVASPKPASKLGLPPTTSVSAPASSKKAKKSAPAKKAKKKKK